MQRFLSPRLGSPKPLSFLSCFELLISLGEEPFYLASEFRMRPLVSNGTAHRHDLNEELFLGRLLEVKIAMSSLDPRSQPQHARPHCIVYRHTYSLAGPSFTDPYGRSS